jgi:hypothetical protein
MSLDFQQIRDQVQQMGKSAAKREQDLQKKRNTAGALLESFAHDIQKLREKAALAARQHDPTLRCALPLEEPLNGHFSQPAIPEKTTLLAADGSQIIPDRHAEVEFGLINVGAIQIDYGSSEPPAIRVFSRLFYGDELYTSTGSLSEATIALRRDLGERRMLAELAAQAEPPVITFTDGLLEIYGPRDPDVDEASEFRKSLTEYLETLSKMRELGVTAAGYVDKPGTTLVVRLLEVALTSEKELAEIKRLHPLRGVYDIDLYRSLLEPGGRSPIFAVQSPSTKVYTGDLALHFFYINVGREEYPWLARVEVPAWVVRNGELLNNLHAILVHQCRVMGTRHYPYLLHRAHETAIVTLQEKEQLTRMVAMELRHQGVHFWGLSHKQGLKDLPGRTRL